MSRTLAVAFSAAIAGLSGLQPPSAPAPPPPRSVAAKAPDARARRAQFLDMFARAYFPGRTGQLMVVPREGHIITRQDPDLRYMHGSPWDYDAEIPLFFAGPGVVNGSYTTPANQQDVATTIAAAIGATMPPTAKGRVLPVIQANASPRAVLLIVLDGMRPDYFEMYARELPVLVGLRKRSAWFTRARVNVLPTNTAVGHSTIATGADPRVHGITGNNLYDSKDKKRHDMFEGWNPRDLMALTLGDVWQLQTNGRAVVIAQGSSLPASTALAGHGACQLNGARVVHAGYDEASGRWNSNRDCFTLSDALAGLDARTLWPADGNWMGHSIATPAAVRRSGLFPQFEADAFVRLIENSTVGSDAVADLLLLNYKGADYVGHKHGPGSPELGATLMEMDRHLSRILKIVEERTGGRYLLAVTADHGMPQEPPSTDHRHFAPEIVDALHARFDPATRGLISYYEPENAQLFVNPDRLSALKLTLGELATFLQSQPFIFAAYTEDEVRQASARIPY